MEKTALQDLLGIAVQVAKKAGAFLMETRKSDIHVNSSNDKDIKLQADVASEQLIIQLLSQASPFDILSEESGLLQRENSGGYRWIVDPLDGSLNYLRGIDIFAVSIGLWKHNEPLLGVVYDFLHNNLYTGIAGTGAWLNEQELHVSDIAEKKDGILVTGFPVYSDFDTETLLHFVKNIQAFKKVRLFGSAAMSLVHVARGSVEAYQENNIAIWDVAAGLPILLGAGGYSEFTAGKGPQYLNVIATNGKIPAK
jgi:fructose-1,6-bisphosphatase/inositol monophosphatase family enzyme